MSPALLLLPACATVTVDRIEDDVAVLDWCARMRTDAPLSLLPPGVAEGDRLRLVRVHPHRRRAAWGHVALVARPAESAEGRVPSRQGAMR